jgi:membrane protein YdbS with pleckstrin-like domain
MIMPDNSALTDRSYELVETIEKRRRLLNAVVIACFLLAPVGIGTDAYVYMTTSHEKGSWSDISTAIIAMVSVISGLLLLAGAKVYQLTSDLKRKLSQMELLEETIYNEVLKPNLHLLR